MSEVDYIILDIDGGEMLLRCLDSIRGQTVLPRSIVVLDNGSREPARKRIRESGVTVVRREANRGFAAGVNDAMAETAGSPFVAMINNDVVLTPDWAASLLPLFDEERRLGGAQTVILRDAYTIDGAGISIRDGTMRQIGHGARLTAFIPETAWGISSTAAIYRREAMGAHPFNEGFFAYYEDVELSARLLENGWTLKVLPHAAATHEGSRTATVLGARGFHLRVRNRYFVCRLHRGIGRVPALLREDALRLVRAVTRLRFREAAATVTGVVAGFTIDIR